MSESLRLITADAPHATGRTPAPGDQCWTLRLHLAGGEHAFIEMGAESLALFRHLALSAQGQPAAPTDGGAKRMTLPEQPEPGVYRHWKGQDYCVLMCANDAETLGGVVIYVCLFGGGLVYVRSLESWNEPVDRDGYRGPRFRKVLL